MKRIIAIQQELKAPKNQYNSFGKYKYRSCEDILEGVKPLLNKHNLLLTVNDEIVVLNNRFYVKATATIFDDTGAELIHACAYAREEESKKGMDGSQVTGASSSYARKYALNGLFAIDDTKDSDATNNTPQKKAKDKEISDDSDIDIIEGLKATDTSANAEAYYNQYKQNVKNLEEFKKVYAQVWKTHRKKEKINAA